VKYLFFLSDFNGKLNFLNTFLKSTQISNFIKIHPVAAELFQADRDMTRLRVVFFCNFANVPKNEYSYPSYSSTPTMACYMGTFIFIYLHLNQLSFCFPPVQLSPTAMLLDCYKIIPGLNLDQDS
jgi:hypothetical protein